MRDLAIHVCWIGSHLIRTLFDQNHHQQLYDSLSTEVKVLQAELHRAHRLIEGYNSLLVRDEPGAFGIWNTFQFILAFLILLIGIGVYFWVRKSLPTPQPRVTLSLGDTAGSSSDSDTPVDPKPVEVRTAGPVRPSSLGKESGSRGWVTIL